ncbi:hypothetical protein SAMN05428985_108104 [Nocardioides sp. YR527]|uniref:hypothetical protein n=1 Tax=Nocardioides sp. YR527 TaxID=1881028 RepID=UPI00088C3B37|nr:hypothetical protein [Nocardioides sp. YR527]SDL01617.1 hypothetical protein SAMN05428985_108104 [Nocardioides sp. YR527]
MKIELSPPRATTESLTFAGALLRCYVAALLVGAPLAALLLTPGLMRSRVALVPGITSFGIAGFLVLSFLLIAVGPRLSARVAPGAGWRPGLVRKVGPALRRELPRQWWGRAGEALLIFVASQLTGGFIAWMMPYIWADPASTDDHVIWVLHYPNYATQAISMYLVICLAAAWFGTRLRQLAVDIEFVDHGQPVS